MSVRLNRLRTDYEKLKEKLKGNPYVSIKRIRGNPPEYYVLQYHVKGISLSRSDKIIERDEHEVEIMLPRYYPRVSPKCRMLTPVFHPNIDELAVCIGDRWAASETLAQLVVRIGEMLAYQSYNIKSPINKRAAKWAALNEHRFPFDASYINFKEEFDTSEERHIEEIEIGLKEAAEREAGISVISETTREPADERPPEKLGEGFEIERCGNCFVDSSEETLSRCVEGHLACKNCIVVCPRCSKRHCLSCVLYTCKECDALVCSFCAAICHICTNSFCKAHLKPCAHCGMLACSDCLRTCSACEKIVCRTHIKRCPKCRELFCVDCASSHRCKGSIPDERKTPEEKA
jgi:ubiquitin-protein ligase